MTDEPPTSEQWQKLYEAAVRVKELSPWEWMNEADVFGVADPEDEEIGFVSVMGMLGEHYAVSLYPNPDALYSLLALEEAGPAINPDAVLELPQIQLSFEDRGELAHADRQMIKDLGFKFRGRKQWPMFRSYRHGYAPWFIEAGEARSLAQALEQLLEVAPRFREDPSLLDPDENSYPVRVPRQQAGEMVWEDAAVEVPPPEPEPIQIQMDTATLQSLQSLPQAGYDLQMDLFMFPTPVQESKDQRPILPYMVLIVEAESGVVVGTEFLTADPSLEEMWGTVPAKVADQLLGLETKPAGVTVNSGLLLQLLQPLAETAGFELGWAYSMPALEEAKQSLFEAFEQ